MGHEVFATDTFPSAPGSHSSYVSESRVTASPRYGSSRFVDEIEAFVRDRDIEMVLPAFEEVFYLAKQRERFDPITHLFAASFETLVRLHDKTQFVELARDLGLAVPDTTVAKNRDELLEAVAEYDKYFARAAYSRGGITLLTNHGPLAGTVAIEDCEPTEDNPFLVQQFVEGLDVCSFSVVQHGKVAAHSTYVHPKTLEHAGGIVFESVDEPETLEITRKIVEATDYHGQISIDFMKTDKGMMLVECNPRPTAGVTVMPAEMFVDAVCNRSPTETAVAPAGVRVKTGVALLRDMIVNWREIPSDIAELLSDSRDVYAHPGDLVPMLYSFLSLGRVAQYRKQLGTGKHRRSDLMASYFYDICWDGEAISPATD
jgi:predicted ATP-grasp superfamily ATP-dependent carboligase